MHVRHTNNHAVLLLPLAVISFAPYGARAGWGSNLPRLAPWATVLRPLCGLRDACRLDCQRAFPETCGPKRQGWRSSLRFEVFAK